MLVACDSKQGKAVLGTEVVSRGDQESNRSTSESHRYRCLCCDSTLQFNRRPGNSWFEYFLHENDDECINDGNVSPAHRLGQEVVSKRIYNSLPEYHSPVHMEIEGRIGGGTDFVISDVRLSEPYQVAVEIVYLSKHISLRRRLKTLFDQNYAAMLIVLTNGRISPERVEHHLKKVAPIKVGRFDPETLKLRLGSVITPSQIDPANTRWDLVPKYLS